MKKSMLTFLVAIALLLSLCACGQNPAASADADSATAAEPSAVAPAQSPSEPNTEETHTAAVTAPTGTYNGLMDEGVEAYLGVRYAAPAELFKAPQPVTTTSSDEISATAFGPSCLQPVDSAMEPSLYELSSDCLTLNIWTKDHETKGKPVMLFIHGGSFVSGGTNDATLYGDNFIRNLPDGEDAVMITINHRLGILGQLDLSMLEGYTDEYADCNNLWILDAIQALKWVNENIDAFGGDPANVTIFGQSSGGMLCYYLTTVAEARQYFQKVIVESGTPFFGLQDHESYQKNCAAIFETLGVSSVDELVALTDEQIMEQMPFVTYVNATAAPRYIDGRVVPLTWWDDFQAGCAKDITLMIGATNGEVDFNAFDAEKYPGMVSADVTLGKLVNHYAPAGTPVYGVLPTQDVIDSMMETMPDDPNTRAIQIYTYFTHEHSDRLICDAQSQYATVYNYSFDWLPDASAITENLQGAIFTPTGRAPHCSELPLIFDTVEDGYTYLARWWLGAKADAVTDKYDADKIPEKLCEQMRMTWYTFAKTGDPNNETIPQWDAYTTESHETMAINTEWEAQTNPLAEDHALAAGIRPLNEK